MLSKKRPDSSESDEAIARVNRAAGRVLVRLNSSNIPQSLNSEQFLSPINRYLNQLVQRNGGYFYLNMEADIVNHFGTKIQYHGAQTIQSIHMPNIDLTSLKPGENSSAHLS